MLRGCFFGYLLLIITSCTAYHAEPQRPPLMRESDRFLVLLVNARHFDYTDGQGFLKTMQRSPDFGHAWICLVSNGKVIEGGHSGELGVRKARYFDGIMNSIEYGCANPSKRQLKNPDHEPNPIKYMWESQDDGFFQPGSGGHQPSYAIKIDINDDQYRQIVALIRRYDFSNYSITGNQCAHFVTQVAKTAGLNLDDKITMSINKEVTVFGERFTLWQEPFYSTITFSSPDKLEESMRRAVSSGSAENALFWYKTVGCKLRL